MSSKKTKKAQTAFDTTAGQQAHALAVQHQAQIEPRLPTGTLADLAADLVTLGAAPTPAQPPASPSSTPSLPDALAAAVNLVSAVHDALLGAHAKPAVRKAYGLGSKAPSKEAKVVLAVAAQIVEEATTHVTEALALGILPEDVTALQKAILDLDAAELAAHAHAPAPGIKAKDKHAAAVRMHHAVGRIAGAGVLAFVHDATVRAQFAALLPKKKA